MLQLAMKEKFIWCCNLKGVCEPHNKQGDIPRSVVVCSYAIDIMAVNLSMAARMFLITR